MIRVELPYPDKLLWPNGRTRSWQAKADKIRKHKFWAWQAALYGIQRGSVDISQDSIPIRLIVSRKAAGVYPDKDNCIAAVKAYLDGIAKRLEVNDAKFAAPTVEFVPQIGRALVIEVGA